MCGIVGITGKRPELVGKMLQTIRHRGPDDSGIWADEKLTLGHVRLSIIDLSSRGHQPMEFEDLVLVFNGEVYNYKEIRAELEDAGYSFFSDSDSEVVLKAFHCWGRDAVEKFRGMFAFAIYDKKRENLYLFRDCVGVKPLYYYFDGQRFAFASELRALIDVVVKKIDRVALASFLQFGYIRGERSIFEGIRKLEAGSFLLYDFKQIYKDRYWDIVLQEEPVSEKEAMEELHRLFIEGFSYRMVSDAPVGVFLSGGADSSLVAAILQKHYGEVRTFTIGFNEKRYDESGYAEAVAKHIGSDHTTKILKLEEAKEILKDFCSIYDEPFGDSSGIPTYLVSRVAKEAGVKVVLSADGGDELFCGYERYWWSYGLGSKIKKVPGELRYFGAGLLEFLDPILIRLPIKNMEHKLAFLKNILKKESWQELYETFLSNYRGSEFKKLLGISAAFVPDRYFTMGEQIHPMQGMMAWDFKYYLPDDILVKVDRATMALSIEGREPMLDHKIIEYAAKLPFELKYKKGESKYIVKKVLEAYLPKELIYRKKMGFGIPIFEWFRGDLGSLFDEYFENDEILNMEYVRTLLKDFRSGKYVNVNKLWFVLVYKMWQRRYL